MTTPRKYQGPERLIAVGILWFMIAFGIFLITSDFRYSWDYSTRQLGEFTTFLVYILVILGFIFITIGIVSKVNESKHIQNQHPNQIFCSGCGNEVKPDAKFCPNCGEKFEEKKEKQINCSKCGNEVNSDDIFCSKCGEKFVKKK